MLASNNLYIQTAIRNPPRTSKTRKPRDVNRETNVRDPRKINTGSHIKNMKLSWWAHTDRAVGARARTDLNISPTGQKIPSTQNTSQFDIPEKGGEVWFFSLYTGSNGGNPNIDWYKLTKQKNSSEHFHSRDFEGLGLRQHKSSREVLIEEIWATRTCFPWVRRRWKPS